MSWTSALWPGPHGRHPEGVITKVPTATDGYRRAFPRMTLPTDAEFVAIDLDRGARPAQASPPAEPVLRGRPLVRRWFLTVTAAEFTGFAVPAAVGALTASARPALALPALLAAGAIEGGLLGLGQALVLRRALPALRRRRWVIATATAAVLAYAIGLAPSTFATSIGTWPVALAVAAAAVLGSALLASIGTAQWLVLRDHVPRARRWIATTAAAWLVGLGVFMGFTMPLWHAGQPIALTIAIGMAGGLLMAATTAAITGIALRRLLERADRAAPTEIRRS